MILVVAGVDRRGLLDPDAVAHAISPLTSAALAVHLTGTRAPMRDLRNLLAGMGTALVADAAHALGATHADGTPVGSIGDAEVFSIGATNGPRAGIPRPGQGQAGIRPVPVGGAPG